jgi:hypothetical protein
VCTYLGHAHFLPIGLSLGITRHQDATARAVADATELSKAMHAGVSTAYFTDNSSTSLDGYANVADRSLRRVLPVAASRQVGWTLDYGHAGSGWPRLSETSEKPGVDQI